MSPPPPTPGSCAPSLPAPPAEDARWFVDEVQTHSRQLKCYLRRAYPSVSDIDDVIQESYLRVWKARAIEPILSARAFLFHVARNVIIDVLRRRQATPIDSMGNLAELIVCDEAPGAVENLAMQENIEQLAAALDALPPRCRDILIFCKLEGHSYREAALRFGVAEKTVAEHVYRGAQRLGDELGRRGFRSFRP